MLLKPADYPMTGWENSTMLLRGGHLSSAGNNKRNGRHTSKKKGGQICEVVLAGSRGNKENEGLSGSVTQKAENVLMYAIETAQTRYFEHGFLGEIEVSASVCVMGVTWTNRATTEVVAIKKPKKSKKGDSNGSDSTAHSMVTSTIDDALSELGARAVAWEERGILDDISLTSVTNIAAVFAELEISFKVDNLAIMAEWYLNDGEKTKTD